MKTQDVGVGWIDLVIVGILVAGVMRGRKRGMSEELLDLVKWMLIVVGAAFAYEPLGSYLSGATPFSRLSSYLAMYALVALAFILLFGFLRHNLGGKLIGSDVFGSAEYYLGMCAGAVRYACILLVSMALLNAHYYSPGEIRAAAKYQDDNFGSDFFPSGCSLQNNVFNQSLIGRLTKSHLGMLLIRPTSPEEKGLSSAGIVRARERSVYEVLEK